MDLFTIFAMKLLTYNDFFDSVSSALTSWTGKLQGLGIAVIIFCVCIIAFMFMFGEGPSRTAKNGYCTLLLVAFFYGEQELSQVQFKALQLVSKKHTGRGAY